MELPNLDTFQVLSHTVGVRLVFNESFSHISMFEFLTKPPESNTVKGFPNTNPLGKKVVGLYRRIKFPAKD